MDNNIALDVLEKNLERIIGFVNNCDSKVSYLLATTGVIITILFTVTPPNLKFIKSTLNNSEPNLLIPISILAIIVSFVYFLMGINYCLKVLIANTKLTPENTESMIFFGSICTQYNSHSYISKFESPNYSYKDDLACQIFINSKICNEKFRNYNIGFKLIHRSLPILILCWSYIF